jgi:hypothetical protein
MSSRLDGKRLKCEFKNEMFNDVLYSASFAITEKVLRKIKWGLIIFCLEDTMEVCGHCVLPKLRSPSHILSRLTRSSMVTFFALVSVLVEMANIPFPTAFLLWTIEFEEETSEFCAAKFKSKHFQIPTDVRCVYPVTAP